MTEALENQVTKQDQYLIFGALTFENYLDVKNARLFAKHVSPKIVREIKERKLTAQSLALYCEEIMGTGLGDSRDEGYANTALELFMQNYEHSGDYRAVIDTHNMLMQSGKLKTRLPESGALGPSQSPKGRLRFKEDNQNSLGLVKRLISPFRKYAA